MRILGPEVLAQFPNRIVNTHPALLPSFPGAHAVADALAYGVTVTGCTVHLVDAASTPDQSSPSRRYRSRSTTPRNPCTKESSPSNVNYSLKWFSAFVVMMLK